ncbi:cytochrome-c peroxidase [Bythopirellula polymerisocia]|nr:cytochrome c peroxidase [Bythopirellula polymerisocia]
MSSDERSDYITELRQLYSGPPSSWPAPHVEEDVSWRELGQIPEVADPCENPRTVEKIELGRKLFFDPRLSGSGQLACASCHEPDLFWSDGRAVSFGHNRTQLTRNAPSLLHGGLRDSFFWDGRAESLEAQAEAVLTNPDEMHSSAEKITQNLSSLPDYTEQFEKVFGIGTPTMEKVKQALAAFERTLVGGQSHFDQFLKGRSEALTDSELAGLHLFRTDARCMNCHHGPLLTDDQFHHIGLSNYGTRFEDLGRYKVTKDPKDVGAFRTPSLRNVGRTAPYMHSGMFTLEEVLTLYNAGMPSLRRRRDQQEDPLFPTKSSRIKPLHLNEQDLQDLEAFLHSLSEPQHRIEPPPLPTF